MRTKLHGVRNCTAPNCTGPYSASLLTGTYFAADKIWIPDKDTTNHQTRRLRASWSRLTPQCTYVVTMPPP